VETENDVMGFKISSNNPTVDYVAIAISLNSDMLVSNFSKFRISQNITKFTIAFLVRFHKIS